MSEASTATVRPDDSTAIALLKEQVAGLTHRLEAMTSERDEYRDALEVIGEERDELQAAATTPDDKDSRIKELEGLIRGRKHRDAFDVAAKEARVNEKAYEDVFEAIRQNPAKFGADPKLFEGDEIDPKALAPVLAKARELRDYAFMPLEEAPKEGANRWADGRFRPNDTPPPVGSDRGSMSGAGSGLYNRNQRLAMLADPETALDPIISAGIQRSIREGLN